MARTMDQSPYLTPTPAASTAASPAAVRRDHPGRRTPRRHRRLQGGRRPRGRQRRAPARRCRLARRHRGDPRRRHLGAGRREGPGPVDHERAAAGRRNFPSVSGGDCGFLRGRIGGGLVEAATAAAWRRSRVRVQSSNERIRRPVRRVRRLDARSQQPTARELSQLRQGARGGLCRAASSTSPSPIASGAGPSIRCTDSDAEARADER